MPAGQVGAVGRGLELNPQVQRVKSIGVGIAVVGSIAYGIFVSEALGAFELFGIDSSEKFWAAFGATTGTMAVGYGILWLSHCANSKTVQLQTAARANNGNHHTDLL